MIGLDPYLHDWDERFHAVVAKNMMDYPFRPMIRLEALLPYKVDDWCCNYIWVHKQPLFLWQMALSMKVFGVNVIALRLPNVLMGTFMTYAIFRIGKIWANDWKVGYLAALLFAVGYYNMELSTGFMSLDHNDLMMGGYVTASIWALCEYTVNPAMKWVIWTGIFAGAAILTKWLTGLLIFGGWGIYLLANKELRFSLRGWLHLVAALLTCVVVFVPWQLYIRSAFPAETAASYAHNVQHIFENLGHPGDNMTHYNFMYTAYSGRWFLMLMGLGFAASWRPSVNRRLSLAMMGMFLVTYLFFSLIVATKMPGLTFPVTAIGFVWIALGVKTIWDLLPEKLTARFPIIQYLVFIPLSIGLIYYSFQPLRMLRDRGPENVDRAKQVHNTAIYKSLHEYVQPDEVILNCKNFEDTEVRFWQPNNAYHWYPTAPQIDSMLQKGIKLCAFKNHNDQALPDYIVNNPKIRILDLEIK